MPQLKKISISRNNILPKLDFVGENIYSTYEIAHHDLTTYVPIFSDTKSSASLSSEAEAESDGASSIPNKPRKRQRLDHLSQEEKIMRRKMKNRVAAQTARDRKKAKMAELEEQVIELETERKMLMLANMNLQAQNEVLQKENEELKKRLSGTDTVQIKEEETVMPSEKVAEVGSRLSDSSRSLEHASFINVPLQKGQDLQLLTLWMMHFAYLPMIARLMIFLIYCNSIVMVYSKLKSSVLFQNSQMLEPLQRAKHQPLKWWGPHQKAWNPTKN